MRVLICGDKQLETGDRRVTGKAPMSSCTKVVLINGFLGSGKTTLLNRLIKVIPKECKMVILMNEFGEIGIDGPVLQGEDLDIIEVTRGSIFCVCVKTDFIKALHKLAHQIKPDLLIIEPTGVANPGDLRADFQLPLFRDRFQILEQVCILDASSFEEAYGAFASVEKQIAASSLFLINKADTASREQIERIKDIVRDHNPSPQFIECVYCDIPVERILGPGNLDGTPDEASGETGWQPLSSGQIDEIVSMILADPFREVTPPDSLMSAAFVWEGEGLAEFSRFFGELPKGIVRGKGFLQDKGKIHLLNIVMGKASYEEFDSGINRDLLGKVVLIFPPELEEPLGTVVSAWGPRLKILGRDEEGNCGLPAFEKPASLYAG